MMQRPIARVLCLMLWTAGLVLPAGCSAPPSGAQVLTIDPGSYDAAFDAALVAVAAEGLPTVMRDRRSGVIETAPAPAPSLLEPWHLDGASFDQRMESTVNSQRRRVRIAFSPMKTEADAQAPATLTGPDLFVAPVADLTAEDLELELRAWVYLERVHRPGLRRHPWSRKLTTRSRITPSGAGGELPSSSWTAVSRDHDFERRLLDRIAAELAVPTREPAS